MTAAARPAPRPGSPVARILLGPLQQRLNMDERWALWLLGVIAVAPVAIAPFNDRLAVGLGSAVVSLFGFGLWAQVFGNLLVQNHPAAARLVPGHVPSLRRAALVASGTGLAVVGVLAACFMAFLAHKPWGPAMTEMVMAALTFAGVALSFITLVMRWPMTGMFGILMPFLVMLAQAPAVRAVGAAVVGAWRAAPIGGAALVLLVAWLLPAALIQSGGAAHEASYERRERMRQRFRQQAQGMQPAYAACFGGGSGWRGLISRNRLYDWWFARSLAKGSTPLRRLFLGLGPTGHWTTVATSLAIMVGFLSLFGVASTFAGDTHLIHGLAMGSLVGSMFFVLTPIASQRARAHQSRVGQGLLVLLPGMPRGATLNRALAWQATREFLLLWVVVGILVLAVTGMAVRGGWHDAIDPRVPRWGIVAIIPFVGFAWRRLDRLPPPSQARVIGDMLLVGVATAAVAAADHWGHVPLAVQAAVLAVVAIATCAWRWRVLGRLPSALPAGRG